MTLRTLSKWIVVACAGALAGNARPQTSLRIYAIDVEGGAATLYVTPQGRSLLIDTGWPTGMGNPHAKPGAPPPPTTPDSAHRIVAVMKMAGITRIDDLLISHYHADHVGGAAELMGLVPVGTVYDHGLNRQPLPANANPEHLRGEPATLYPGYIAAIGNRPHHVVKPGDRLHIDGLTVTFVDSDRAILAAPLPTAGEAVARCASATSNSDLGGEENPRSAGVVMRWGKARILALADTTWNVENSLVCPRDLIGPVDVMLADNHGSDNANSPVLVDTVKPRVVIFDNGPTKGEGPQSLATMEASPRIQAIWQIHFAEQHPDQNAPSAHIENLPGEADAMHPVELAVSPTGAITATNLRTGQSETYR